MSQQEPTATIQEPILLGQERILPKLEVRRGLEGYQTLLLKVSHD